MASQLELPETSEFFIAQFLKFSEKNTVMQEDGDLILETEVKSNMWSIRPCQVYKGLSSKVVIFRTCLMLLFCSFRGISRLQKY